MSDDTKQRRDAAETIFGRLDAMADRRPGKVFCDVLAGDRRTQITFGSLRDNSWRFARRLSRAGVRPGDIVAIMLRHSPELYETFIGAMAAGAVPAFMPFPNPKQDPEYFWASHRGLFARTGIGTLIAYPELAAAGYFGDGVRTLAVPAEATPAGDAPACPVAANGGTVALLQHSSGTTGLKKGVMLTHRAVLGQVDAYAAALGFGQDDVVATWLPLYHDMGLVAAFLLPLLTGARVVALDPFEWVAKPLKLLEAIATYRATFAWLPNFAFRHVENAARRGATFDLSSLRALIDCSEPCRADTLDSFVAAFAASGLEPRQLSVCYAMAENVFAVTQTPPGAMPPRIRVDRDAFETRSTVVLADEEADALCYLSCGRALAGCEVAIVGEDRRPLPEDRVGEVAISGDFLFEGYWRRPEATAERYVDGWYYTGDLGFRHAGELYVTGRKDDLIIVHGRNLYAHEIEGCLDGCPGLTPGRAVALGVENPRTGTRDLVIVAEIEPGQDDVGLRRSIKRLVLDRVGVSVTRVVVVDKGWLVKSTSGKISRRRNMAKYATNFGQPAEIFQA
jgi:fatty-acyl-CoA synthase